MGLFCACSGKAEQAPVTQGDNNDIEDCAGTRYTEAKSDYNDVTEIKMRDLRDDMDKRSGTNMTPRL